VIQRREMLALLPRARELAYAPVSGFHVGAVVQGVSGQLYLGANIELPGQPLAQTVHAEQAALANAYMAGERAVEAIAVTAAPCGHCRQFLKEFSPDGSIRVIINSAPAVRLSTLLPQAFGPLDLGRKRGALPVTVKRLSLNQPADALTQAALHAARRSYAPYTRAYSGIALLTTDGQIFPGSYIENAAFNPSLPALQVALAGLLASGRTLQSIERSALVRVADEEPAAP
jgi:cytidine deaminase